MKLRTVFVIAALMISGVGVAGPVHARAAVDLPPAYLYPSSAGDCSNVRDTDCGMLTLKAIMPKDRNPVGSTVTLRVTGCEGDTDVRSLYDSPGGEGLVFPRVGEPFAVEKGFPSEDGSAYEVPFGFWTNYPGETFHLGPKWSGSLTVERPGLAPWTYAFDHSTPVASGTFGIWTDGLVCPRDDKDSAALVDTWSRTRSKPIVGRKVVATPTVLVPVGAKVGATISYAWLVNGKAVRRSLNARVKRAYVGKTLAFRFTVRAPGKESSGATITLGRVRLRR